MNSKLIKSRKVGALLGAFLLLAFIPNAGFADFTITCVFDITTNFPGGNFGLEQAQIRNNARWGVFPNPVTNINGYTTPLLTDSPPSYYIFFNAVKNYYIPSFWEVPLTVNTNITNFYVPYSNTLAVTVAGITTTTNLIWTLSGPPEFTNAASYGTTFTNTYTNTHEIALVPTGNYSVTFPATVYGYTLSSANPLSTNITGASPLVNSVTGTYARQYGTLQINVLPPAASNATWTLITKPDDYTNLVTGTGTYTIASAPVGNYTVQFNTLSGWTTPGNASGAVSDGATRTLSGTYTFLSYNLIVNIGPPYSSQSSLPGKGAGYVIVETTLGTYSQTLAQVTYPVTQDTAVSLTAYPNQPGGTSIDNFVYKWYRDIGSGGIINETLLNVTNYTFSMSMDNDVWLLFSKEKYSYDNVGDIDQDGLPDEWEIAQFGDELYGGPAEDDTFSSGYGQFSNPDGDFIPSASPNPPVSVLIITNIVAYSSQGGDADPPGYPLLHNRLLTRDTVYVPSPSLGLGYASGIAFNNFLECRGLDGYYRNSVSTNSGLVYTNRPGETVIYGDDPRTDPDVGIGSPPPGRDTDGDTMSDGWEYYFWYWRSAQAYAIGITNSANLSWVAKTNDLTHAKISPIMTPEKTEDTDLDGINDITEFTNGTDPTHCDTDGDGMDDYWEINKITTTPAVSNALDNANWSLNPDGDYMAWVNQGMLTTGMVGTVLGTNVCYTGASNNPSAAWIEISTNTGAYVFDLYRDTILKTSVTLTNHTVGTNYVFTNYYGTTNTLTSYKDGYPVWVDADNSGTYTTNDYALVNPLIKHDAVYLMAPTNPFPGVTSFDPRTAWTNFAAGILITNSSTNVVVFAAPNTIPYTTYQEYLGGDYLGRLSWDAGGQMTAKNDPDIPTGRNNYTLPNNQDTDVDRMPDGWELYVGLNPNDIADAGLDVPPFGDGDGLNNFSEWANATHALGTCIATWPNKPWPTDPGVLVAPAPNDPHPKDTDWDGITDSDESALSNPTQVDTDTDGLPDGWERYAGTSVTNSDANLDTDFDGLLNWQEYWTGTVPEWMDCDPAWGLNFLARRLMEWDRITELPSKGWETFGDPATVDMRWFMPPDFMTCPSFLYANGAVTNLDWLRSTNGFPAASSLDYVNYHTTLASTKNALGASPPADPTDSDGDGMDDFWEVFHCLNPIRGFRDLMYGAWNMDKYGANLLVGSTDADPTQAGYQAGTQGAPFANVMALVNYYQALRALDPVAAEALRAAMVVAIVGPHNFGLVDMDPDGDSLGNFYEYTYYRQSHLHTAPSPLWRTSPYAVGVYSFVGRNYTRDNTLVTDGFNKFGFSGITYSAGRGSLPFRWAAMTEGFDTDNDLISDYEEATGYRTNGVVPGTDPLHDESPLRNRVLWLDGTNSWLRSYAWSHYGNFTKFSVEAWVRPLRLITATDQVVVEKTSGYTVQLPGGSFQTSALANFQLGISANGMPYILFHDVSGYTTNRAIAARVGILQVDTWAHLAGVFDGSSLTLYVNGEATATHRTTAVPARGIEGEYSVWHPNCNLSVGARELSPGWMFPVTGEKFFAGCIDEVRVWDRVLSSGEIIARKDRRLTAAEVGTILGGNEPYTEGANNLFAYYRFTDLPDPNVEGKVPSGFPSSPPSSGYYSLVYTNYLVIASDRVKRIPRLAPLDTRVIDGVPVSTNPPPDAYGISTTNYLSIQLPSDFRNSANPYNFTHSRYNIDMGRGMWLCGYAQGLRTNIWLDTLDPNNPDSTDTDGDGLPDWWEQKYGLDPNDATGDNGAWGDPDRDGLNNRAEYLAGTNPLNSDTYNTGIGDYDYHSGPYTRTLGEIYMDGDGMPDVWESLNGLDPQKYDANLDLDGDGWSNYAEYQAGTAPNNKYDYPQPLVSGTANYYGGRTGTPRFYAYEINTMDGVPQITKVGTDSLVAEVVGQANGTMIFTGRLPIAPIDETTVVRISATVSTNNMFVTFTFTGPETYTYSGVGTDYGANLNYVNGRFTLRWASAEVPLTGANVSVEYSYVNRNAAAFSLSGFKEGDFYMLSLLDANGNGAFDAGEPMGIMDDQPVYLSYSSISGIRVWITDTRPGFGRFTWTASATVTNNYPVVINKISESGAPTIIQRAMGYPRNYFHEWDFQLAGIEGLAAGSYQWWMNSQNGTFQVNWPASLATPVLVYPRGDMLYYARNQFTWTMDLNCPMAHIQIARQASNGDLAFVTDKYVRASWMDQQNIFHSWMTEYASDWGNGVYYWRVAGWTPQGESAWSDVQTFNVNLSATNSHWVSGDIYYFGKAPATKIIVEAYYNRGFGGPPTARMTLTPPAVAGWVKCSYTLRGLEQGSYYVRAFLDVDPAGSTAANNKPDAWESFGFYRDPYNSYQAGLVNLSDAQFMDGAKIIIRDRNTDNDELPDAWEMYYFGNLDQTGDMDYDGDGETNLEEYIKEGVNQNPAAWDTDGDGLADGFEPRYNGAAFGFTGSAKAVGTVLNPNVWDTDGDGYSDGAELMRYHTDPLDPTSYPSYRPLCTDAWASPGDYDGDGRSDFGIYDFNAGSWSFITMAGQADALAFGIKGAQPMVGDYTGDGCSEFAFYDRGLWTIYMYSGQSATMRLGDASMLPVPADYTGDGRVDPAVFDTDNGMWYIYDIWSGAMIAGKFGEAGMIPVSGDYNGDGVIDPAVYQPATGYWMIGCYHRYFRTWTILGGTLGGPSWMPVPGDYDGDGRNDICLFESNTGRWMLYTLAGQFVQGPFGWKGCVPVPGDYDGDGRTDLAIYDKNTGMWYIICWSGAHYEGRFGWPGVLPILKGR